MRRTLLHNEEEKDEKEQDPPSITDEDLLKQATMIDQATLSLRERAKLVSENGHMMKD